MHQLPCIVFVRRFKSYAKERTGKGGANKGEHVQSFFCLIQCILLGSFAIVLGAHRDDIILDSKSDQQNSKNKGDSYDPPSILSA